MKRLCWLLAAVVVAGCASKKAAPKELHLFIWANYIDPAVYADFEKETGIRVVEENFDSNETLRAKLEAGATGYDVIVPSDYTVQALVKGGLLAEIDPAKVPNLKHVGKRFRGLYYDPQNKFTVPYLWGTTGIGFDSTKCDPAPASWADVFDPALLAKHKGRVAMLDDPREAIGAALKWKGHSLNSAEAKDLEEAKGILLAQKEFVGRYDSETYDDLMLAGNLDLAQGWSGDFAKARAQNPKLKFVIPKEGGVIWADNLAIPKSSKNLDAALKFVDFLLRPEVNARIVNFIRYPSTNDAAREFIKKEVLDDPGIYPPDDVVNRLEWIRDAGEASDAYDRLWTEVKSK